MERLLSDEIRRKVAEVLGDVEREVELLLVAREEDDEADVIAELLAEVAEASPRLSSLRLSPEAARREGLVGEPHPAVYVRAKGGPAPRFRFLGAPAGYEFGSLVEDVRDVARGTTGLSEETRAFLASLADLAEPGVRVELEVYTTPTCPYCPRAVRLAHQMAMESERVTAVAIDALSFPELADRHSVYAVPKTVINGVHSIEGMVPEAVLVAHIREALGA